MNMKDVPEIPESARKKLKFLPMETVDDVLKAALLKG
jgi:ATP-dependent Lon protease